jgi:hypothetical protein
MTLLRWGRLSTTDMRATRLMSARITAWASSRGQRSPDAQVDAMTERQVVGRVAIEAVGVRIVPLVPIGRAHHDHPTRSATTETV